MPRRSRRSHVDPAAQTERRIIRVDVAGDLLVEDEPLVEARRLSAREHFGQHVARGLVVGERLDSVPHHLKVRQLGQLVLDRLLRERRDRPRFDVRTLHFRPARDGREVFVDEPLRDGRIEVPDQDERCIVGTVEAAEEVAYVLERRRLDLGNDADDTLEIRVRQRVEEIANALLRRPVRNVFDALAELVADDVALDLQLLLVQRGQQEAHAVAFQPERRGQLVGGYRLVVVGAVEVRRSVPARRADRFENGVGVLRVHRAGEHHVLEQVREPAAPRRLVRRADVVPDVHRYLRQPVVLAEDDGQPVLQAVLLELHLRVRGAGLGRAQSEGGDRDAAKHVVKPPLERTALLLPGCRRGNKERAHDNDPASQVRASEISSGTTMWPIGYSRYVTEAPALWSKSRVARPISTGMSGSYDPCARKTRSPGRLPGAGACWTRGGTPDNARTTEVRSGRASATESAIAAP